MKKLSLEEIKLRIDEAALKTGYEYIYTGKETQKNKIIVKCHKHNYEQLQTREYVFQARKIKCCNEFSPMLFQEYESFIKKFKDYTNITIIGEFIGYETQIQINCSIHKSSRIIKLSSLLAKKTEYACNKCSHEKFNRNHAYSKQKWIDIANKVHNNKYDYTNMEDSGVNRTITCKIHGDFIQNIHNHVYLSNGCPKCVVVPMVSHAEHELNDYFLSIGFQEGIDYVRSSRAIIHPFELDFYFPKLKIGIEYNGDYWHSTDKKDKLYHQNKKLDGIKKYINIIMIYEYQWKTKQDIIKNRLKSILGKDNIIFARKTKIKEVEYKIAKDFCNNYHLQGSTVSSIQYGLYFKDELVALMTFGKSRFTDHQYELLRYVSRGTIVGGASKLFNHFKNTFNPESILSYADLDWSIGNMYEKIGLTKISITQPSYVWIKGSLIYSRYQTQIKDEDNIMLSNGFIKVYKCGSLKYVWTKKKEGGE